jgi:hypothetical protein
VLEEVEWLELDFRGDITGDLVIVKAHAGTIFYLDMCDIL